LLLKTKHCRASLRLHRSKIRGKALDREKASVVLFLTLHYTVWHDKPGSFFVTLPEG
jgi:hypothetical protein